MDQPILMPMFDESDNMKCSCDSSCSLTPIQIITEPITLDNYLNNNQTNNTQTKIRYLQ